MSDHLLWVEVRDSVLVGTRHRAYSFFGHPSLASSLYAPQMDVAYLLTPLKEKIVLELQKGDWLPGYGNIEYLFSDIDFSSPGDYAFVVARSPGVYDLGWHGGKSDPFLSYNFAKAIIHAGDGPKCDWNTGLPLELIPEQAPYNIKSGEPLAINVKHQGKSVKASYTASYWTWDEHGDPRVLGGVTDDNGRFAVRLDRGGLWFITAAYSLADGGEWRATHSLGHFFKEGEVLKYNSTRYKTTLSIWVK